MSGICGPACDLINQIAAGTPDESWHCRTHNRPYFPNRHTQPGAFCRTCGGTPDHHIPSMLDPYGRGEAGHWVLHPDNTGLRERLKALKPHTEGQLPLGDLLSYSEVEAIMRLLTRECKAAELEGRLDEVNHIPDNFFQVWDGENITARARRAELQAQIQAQQSEEQT